MNTQLFIVPQLLQGVGPINAAAKKMAEQMGTDDPREVFRRINSGEWVVSAAAMPVWKTVKLGIYKTPDEYRKALKSAGRRIDEWGDDILGRITCSQKETDLDLVVRSVGDLGFRDGACYADICARAQEIGLELCSAEVGPALRLQYGGDQPNSEWLRIAMEIITDRGGSFSIFSVAHDDGDLLLDGDSGRSGFIWHTDNRFVFGRRK